MVELVTAAAVLLLVAGVAGSFLPLLPAGLLSLAGVYVYALAAPAGAPRASVWLLVGLTVVGLLTALLEQFGGAVASKAGGAETTTTVAAALASVLLLFVVGPLGVVVGTVGVVLAAELSRGKPPRTAAVAAVWTAGGILASSVAQFLLTLSMLVAFVVFVFLV
ncbi:DUF456 family protein [Candidatus Halobonum tyrrellensis]|uniref:DUF456 domain-containing protein n=1 Tax=Candidatus Halobonum tyrrellensis G22 TaxID=1324957 RepID=V4HMD8_9EURY|nr:DUF456 family protein [Candidatus Halobonum tyrrellensis]ESP89094.1 hypothetical protein K933_05803 [Candidatus Halobonum tyrrellensis G22]